ncbi:MAG: hypothetical protein ACYSTJ_10660, partial [Planctomycetota bacterium]
STLLFHKFCFFSSQKREKLCSPHGQYKLQSQKTRLLREYQASLHSFPTVILTRMCPILQAKSQKFLSVFPTLIRPGPLAER